MSTAELNVFYRQQAPQLFALTRNRLKRLLYSRYDGAPMETKLREVFGVETKLGSDKLKTQLMLARLLRSRAEPRSYTCKR